MNNSYHIVNLHVWHAERGDEMDSASKIYQQEEKVITKGTPSMSSRLYACTCIIHLISLNCTQQRGETPLHHAAMWRNAEVVCVLLIAGFKFREKDQEVLKV